jgi:hypothetical protein
MLVVPLFQFFVTVQASIVLILIWRMLRIVTETVATTVWSFARLGDVTVLLFGFRLRWITTLAEIQWVIA